MRAGSELSVRIGGLTFVVAPRRRLSRLEEEWLLGLDSGSEGSASPDLRPFRLDIVNSPTWTSDDPMLFPEDRPARIEPHGQDVRISRSDFVAELDPVNARGSLFRRDNGIAALQVALKTALASRLPFEGGLPIHGAAVVRDGNGLLFFGPSGAGKSTLAATSPHPLLSDELVALVHEKGFRVRSTGFWGTLDRDGAPRGSYPLAAAFELAKGPGFDLDRLDARAAFRRLLGVVLVPPSPGLWMAAMRVLERLVTSVPAFRMSWSPDAPPWGNLAGVE